MDFSVFDVLLDSIFIVNKDHQVVYCNEVGATLAGSSVRRMTKGKKLEDFVTFSEENIYDEAGYPLTEINYKSKSTEDGKVQLAVQPFALNDEPHWILIGRDVTIEEVLHEKHKKQLEELENYSKNLEKMVAERTAELQEANQTLSAIMNSLGQGFLLFNSDGKCLDIYTKACENILESVPAGQHIVQVLNLTGANEEQFRQWLQVVFSQALPFDTLKEVAPETYSHSLGKFITLDYFAIYNNEDDITKVVLVATDKTEEKEAKEALEKEKAFAHMIIKMITSKKQFTNFLQTTTDKISELQALAGLDMDVDYAFRVLHTIEGEAASLSIETMKQQSKVVQSSITRVRNGELKLEAILEEYKQELVTLQDRFDSYLNENQQILSLVQDSTSGGEVNLEQVHKYYQKFLDIGVDQKLCQQFLQDFSFETVQSQLKHYNDTLQSVALKQSKQVSEIKFSGAELKVDPVHFHDLFSSFVHIFRNIVDHGFELPEERLAAGKVEAGSVEISCDTSGDWIEIKVSDDGKGINPQIIKSKYLENNPDKNLDQCTEDELLQLIFEPGFSSRNEAGEFSGRGVGMDAVKFEVKKLNGEINVSSRVGQGTCVTIKVPMFNLDNKSTEAA